MPTEPGEPRARAAEPHSAEQSIIDARRAKAEALRQRHENPFANDVAAWGNGIERDDIADVRVAAADALHDGKYVPEEVAKLGAAWGEVHVCGRVMALRSTGGLSFVRLR